MTVKLCNVVSRSTSKFDVVVDEVDDLHEMEVTFSTLAPIKVPALLTDGA